MRGLKIEFIKAWKTLFFLTAPFGNLNKFVLPTCSKCYEINTQERKQVLELLNLAKTIVFSTAAFENFDNFVL